MRWWSWVGLVAVLVFDIWLRCHTVGPTLRAKVGVDLYPVTSALAEPLDCDEAVYAYIGKRIAHGAVMYRDMTENKPPLGYWLYAVAVGLFGASELTVRLMPVPMVLATIALVWWLALRLRGPGAAVIAALIYAVISTDPFVHGHNANMEHMVNLFATASLAMLVARWDRPRRWGLIAAGLLLGLASLVKPIAVTHGVVYAFALLFRGLKDSEEGEVLHTLPSRFMDVAALALGCALAYGTAAAVVTAQGAARDAYEDVFRYGPALAAETPPPPSAPPKWERWVTGNADPEGKLPWPFGTTNYLVWWGTGTWPVWIAAAPALAWLLLAPRTTGPRRLVAFWTLSAWVQVALPGLFWQHYYLLPLPGIAIAIAVFLGDQLKPARPGPVRYFGSALVAVPLLLALAWTGWLQWNEYLRVPPQQLVRATGGEQWVVDRSLGREIGRRSAVWNNPRLFVWGWQSPLYFYSGIEPATRQLFADDFIRAFAGRDHPLVKPRVDRIMADLNADPPGLIFTGYPPFPALRQFLEERYLPSRVAAGLWVERDKFGEFEAFGRK